MSPLAYRTSVAEEDLGVPVQSRHLYRLSVTAESHTDPLNSRFRAQLSALGMGEEAHRRWREGCSDRGASKANN